MHTYKRLSLLHIQIHIVADDMICALFQVALDILQTLVRSSSVPLSDPLMNQAFPAAVQCTVKTDDNATMQVS